jgi:hypothetical protein
MQSKKTLRPLLGGFSEFREDGLGSQLWHPLTDELLDWPIPEDMRHERQGSQMTSYKLNPVSLHWYVCGKYELR